MEVKRFCSACGNEINASAAFCDRCGAQQSVAQADRVFTGRPAVYSGHPAPPVYSAPPPAPQKKRGFLKTVGIGCGSLILIVLAIGVVGSAISGTPTPSPAGALIQGGSTPVTSVKPGATTAPSIGSVVTGKNWTYVVDGVERLNTLPGGSIDDGKPKGVWVVVYVTVTNIAKANFSLNSHDFELHDNGGVKYSSPTLNFRFNSFLESKKRDTFGGQIPPGIAVKSGVVFDINPAAKGLKLWLEQERIYVDLGQ